MIILNAKKFDQIGNNFLKIFEIYPPTIKVLKIKFWTKRKPFKQFFAEK
jgi:hypothetical protein